MSDVRQASAGATGLAEAGKSYGGNPRRREHDFGRVFTGMLFALFVVTLLMAILAGTGVYRSLHEEGEATDNQRLSLALIANDVRANDEAGAVARAWVTDDTVELEIAKSASGQGQPELAAEVPEVEGSMLQGPALVLRESLDGSVYETRIYRYNGTIMEEYALADAPYSPDKATPIVESSVFDFSYQGGLLTIATDAGEVSVAVRSGGGER